MKSGKLKPDCITPLLATCHCSLATVFLEREAGIEPATNSLEGCDSTIELLPPLKFSGKWGVDSGKRNLPFRLLALNWALITRHCLSGGQGRIRTSVDHKGRQIYSLLLLTAQPPVQVGSRVTPFPGGG